MTVPAGTVVATLFDEFYNEIGPLEIADNSAAWEEQLSETGNGSVVIQAYTPGGVAVDRPTGDQFVTFGIADGAGGSVNAWTLRVDDDLKVRKGTLDSRKITVNGRGPLAMYQDTAVYPTLGYGAFPLQLDMYYDWRHVDFDDSSWVAPTSIMPMTQAKGFEPDGVTVLTDPNDFWGHSPFLVWSFFFPAGPPPYPDPDILWASSGSETDAPTGKCYFRQRISLPFELTYVMWLSSDNRAVAYLDGVELGSTNGGGTSPDTAGWIDAQQPIWFKASAGDHVLAIEAENLPRSDSVSGNPAGVAWNIFIPGFPVTLAMCIAHSNTGDVVMVEYPSEAPGMSLGNAIRLFVEKSQEYGDIGSVDISSFSDSDDSAGEPWPTPYPCISTKVLTDGLAFLREVSGTYGDMRADRDNPFRLLLYAKDTMNFTASGVSFVPGSTISSMQIRRDYRLANVLIGVTKFGYVEVSDSGSVADHGRHVRRFELGSVDNPDEAVRVLTEALARYADLRDEISVEVDGVTGYVDYDLGQTAPTIDSDDVSVTERIVAIAVRMSPTARAWTTPTLKDLLLA